MKVLVACECSGRVKTAFRQKGHDSWSCDLKPSEIENDQYHIQDNVLNHLDGWDMMIAHPDCTYLANSGVRWLIGNEERYVNMIKACKFFNELLDANIPLIAIENPIQHKYARLLIRKPDQIIQPYYFGDMESKATCLWLKGLSPLISNFTGGDNIKQSIWREPPRKNRKANRSRTFIGIANAMAEQWSLVNLNK